ncbi:hypothetical protein Taro_017882 [Colocasia esculenta]|uniref:Uncharacterized protein n=1 Tax=Colocasia esculenta TaxID=4460 RepID=A0A843USG5_COLES|nr:hypothetical protein [Colocasia esculenta]
MTDWSAVFVGRFSGFGGLGLKSLASTSIDARFISQDINGWIDCRLFPLSGSRCGRQPVHPSVVVRRLFRNASLVGYPKFFVSQARVFVVLGVLSRYLCCTVEVCVVFLDTLTPEFELYVQLRERRQWGSDFPEFVLLSLQLDLSSVTARLRGSSCVVLSGLDIGLISQ